jgi:putative exporter of polyketide antibiotics
VDNLILTLLSGTGLCLILKYGSIFNLMRDFLSRLKIFRELFSCSLCLGTWTGFLVGIISSYNFILIGFAVALLSWLCDHIILLLKVKIWPDVKD